MHRISTLRHPCPFLVIEGNASHRFLIRRVLLTIGIAGPFEIVPDAQEAISYLEGEGAYTDRDAFPFPSLILTDLHLPRGGGFQLLDYVRTRTRTVPLVIFSASMDPQDIANACLAGADAYYPKPERPEDFVRMLKLIFEFWCCRALQVFEVIERSAEGPSWFSPQLPIHRRSLLTQVLPH